MFRLQLHAEIFQAVHQRLSGGRDNRAGACEAHRDCSLGVALNGGWA